MKTRFVALKNCSEGTILAENISSGYGAMILAKDTVLNGYMINRLLELGIQRIRIFDDIREGCCNSKGNRENIRKSYRKNIMNIKSVVNQLAAGKPLNAARISDISDTIYSGIANSANIVEILKEEEDFDEYTYTHSLNVAFYSMLIGKWLKLDSDSIKSLIKAGLLHDIGKTRIPVEILNKKARLSEDEFRIVKKHTFYGYELIKSSKCFSEEICEAVLTHHEREDKSGYPLGIGRGQISKFAEIIAIADVYDAMTSERVYKKRLTPFDVFDMLQTIGIKSYNPGIIKVFLSNLSSCYIGSKVMLHTGEIGEIVYIPPHCITEPVISVGADYLDLGKNRDKHILVIV